MIEAGILDDCRVELLRGEIVEMSPEGEPHAFYSTSARDYLIRRLGDRALVRDGKPVTLPILASEPEPDLAIVQPLGREYLNHHPYPQNIFWVIEFSNSSLKKDLNPKAKIYAAAGLAEYWVANLQAMELVVMRDPLNGEYQLRTTHSRGVIYPLAFPDLEIAVEQLIS
jgi:Uma2 family endonuclease